MGICSEALVPHAGQVMVDVRVASTAFLNDV
jgi:hypothetical protein